MSTQKVIDVYEFAELSEAAKEKAIDWYANASMHDEWWESIYDDAENVGLKITGFDRGRGNDITGDFIGTAEDTARKILEDHGDVCDTYATAKTFLSNFDRLTKQCTDCIDQIDRLNEKDDLEWTAGDLESHRQNEKRLGELEDEIEELEADFLKSILEDYLITLRKELEYVQSREHIIENIEANEYGFSESGSRSVVL